MVVVHIVVMTGMRDGKVHPPTVLPRMAVVPEWRPPGLAGRPHDGPTCTESLRFLELFLRDGTGHRVADVLDSVKHCILLRKKTATKILTQGGYTFRY